MFSKGNSSNETSVATDTRLKGNSSSMPSIVSANLRITGDLVSDGDIQVEGAVEGNIKSRMLTIGESGSVKGEVVADQITVAGVVVGKIRAGSVTLAHSADVTGDISHESLGIEAGARFEGNCKQIDPSKDTAPAEPARKSKDASPSVTSTSASGGAASAASSSNGGASGNSAGSAKTT